MRLGEAPEEARGWLAAVIVDENHLEPGALLPEEFLDRVEGGRENLGAVVNRDDKGCQRHGGREGVSHVAPAAIDGRCATQLARLPHGWIERRWT